MASVTIDNHPFQNQQTDNIKTKALLSNANHATFVTHTYSSHKTQTSCIFSGQ